MSPWLDATLRPLNEVLDSLEAQAHRRVIKAHTPFDGIAYFSDAHYVAVYRDLATCFSRAAATC